MTDMEIPNAGLETPTLGCDPNCQRRLQRIESLYKLYRLLTFDYEKGDLIPDCIATGAFKGINILHSIGVNCPGTASSVCEVDRVLPYIEPILGEEVRNLDLTKKLTEISPSETVI